MIARALFILILILVVVVVLTAIDNHAYQCISFLIFINVVIDFLISYCNCQYHFRGPRHHHCVRCRPHHPLPYPLASSTRSKKSIEKLESLAVGKYCVFPSEHYAAQSCIFSSTVTGEGSGKLEDHVPASRPDKAQHSAVNKTNDMHNRRNPWLPPRPSWR